jgi:phage gp29-like protein
VTPKLVPTEKPGLNYERIKNSILFKFNPVRQASAERLGTELDSFYSGRLTIARFWDAMQNRDDMIRSATGKRADAVEQLEWQVVQSENADEIDAALAEEQVATLKEFYSNLKVTDVYKQDANGGLGLLARQMLDARAKGWAVHEITWLPQVDGKLKAELRFCPLYWFENTTGKLRFLLNDWEMYGVDMLPNEWLVTASDNFMESVTSLWLYKKELLQAWVRFCARYGMPLPVIKTDASPGSDQWDDAVEAASSITEDWAIVLNNGASLEFPSLDRSGDGTFKALYEDLKRTLVTVILGSDLATISAGGGQGQGASLQGKEDSKREKADASLISETLQRSLDKFVLEYTYGEGAPILAKFTLVPSKNQDVNAEIAVDRMFREMGIPLSVNDVRERYGRAEPAADEDMVGPMEPQRPASQAGQQDQEGDDEEELEMPDGMSNEVVDDAKKSIAKARAQDLESVARELTTIMSVKDPQAVLRGLKHFIANTQNRAQHLIHNPDRLAHEIEKLLATSFISGATQSKA